MVPILLNGFEWTTGGSKQQIWMDEANHIHEIATTVFPTVNFPPEWSHADLTALTGAPVVDLEVNITGYDWPAGGTKQIVFADLHGHIHELYVAEEGSWSDADLTQLTGCPTTHDDDMVAYSWDAGSSKQVVYVGDDGHIHELSVSVGGSWQDTNLTMLAGVPRDTGGSKVYAYEWKTLGSKHVIFIDNTTGHIHELSTGDGVPWNHLDISQTIGAPAADGTNLIGYGWNARGSNQIVYTGVDGHIHELWRFIGTSWHHADLTALTGAPPVTGYFPRIHAYAWEAGNAKQVVYTAITGVQAPGQLPPFDIYEMWVEGHGEWRFANLTHSPQMPAPQGEPFGYEWSLDGSKRVIFPTADRHVYELSVSAGNAWSGADLTVASGAPPL